MEQLNVKKWYSIYSTLLVKIVLSYKYDILTFLTKRKLNDSSYIFQKYFNTIEGTLVL